MQALHVHTQLCLEILAPRKGSAMAAITCELLVCANTYEKDFACQGVRVWHFWVWQL